MGAMIVCSKCGAELQVGDWPFCDAPGGHGSVYSQRAQHFTPIVVDRASDGAYSFPASSDAPLRPGYERVEVRTLREADRIVREVNVREDATARKVYYHTEAERDRVRAQNRNQLDEMKKQFSQRGLAFAAGARRYMDGKPRPAPGCANFHFDVFAHDSSNREAHSDARTDWKSRRV